MHSILLLFLFQSILTSQIFGSDQCNYKGRFDSYLDAAIDLIKKARTFVPKSPYVTPEETSASIEDESVMHSRSNHSIIVPQGNVLYPMDCEEVLRSGYNQSGVYTIWPRSRVTDGKPLKVYCDMNTDDGGWTMIQRRGNFNRSKLFFFQEWSSYKNGFGDIEEDFWLGNDNIFALTNQREYSIRFDLKSKNGEERYALYDDFWIDDEDRKYTLHIKNYSGNAGDSMIRHHANQKFSTKDQDNDEDGGNCAETFKSGWWFQKCLPRVNLNGFNRKDKWEEISVDGIIWESFKGLHESLAATEMKIRPVKFQRS